MPLLIGGCSSEGLLIYKGGLSYYYTDDDRYKKLSFQYFSNQAEATGFDHLQ